MSARLTVFVRHVGLGLWIVVENAHLASQLAARWPADYGMTAAHLLIAEGGVATDLQRLTAALALADPATTDLTALHLCIGELETARADANRLHVLALRLRDGLPIGCGVERFRTDVQALFERLLHAQERLAAMELRERSTTNHERIAS